MRTCVFLDHNATTPVDPAVLTAMAPYWAECAANPSSVHRAGVAARRAVDAAREQVAAFVGVQPAQVIFTSGGSEANNLFLRGAAAVRRPGWVLVSAAEHACVRRPAKGLARAGWQVGEVGLDAEGRIDAADLRAQAMGGVGVASFIAAHNETGVLQDIPALADIARAAGAAVHTDAVQMAGKLPIDFAGLGVDALSLSAHKLHGPKGIGALVVGKRLDLRAQIEGGGHEHGLRAGTENVPAIVGFGVACELAAARMAEEGARQTALRDGLVKALQAEGAVVFGAGAARLPNTVFFAVRGVDGATLLLALDEAGFALGSGSACSSSDHAPSPTLLAMGVAPDLARGAVRVSIGRSTAAAQLQQFRAALATCLAGLRGLASVAV
ncbi:MAG: cysteine desulfurase [Rhodocyclaceae bacterium]|nr:cysteine desulfurase [Rhodocyclaceae bacterium]